jgi:hypothetical protein
VVGYLLQITLAAGANLIAPAADTFQAGNFMGAPGMSNFAASPVNSTFEIAFVQHEPGPVCSTLMDKQFSQNYDECLRHYQKTYDYPTAPGTVTSVGSRTFLAPTAVTSAFGSASFHKPMAKVPTVTLYDHNNGAANSVMDNGGVHHTGAATTAALGSTGFPQISFTTATSAIMPVFFHYTADTGW